jgi:hypothetical protein
MTSDEIQSHRAVYSADQDPPCNGDTTDLAYSQICWLKEIAYQLAVMNEREDQQDRQLIEHQRAIEDLIHERLGSNVGAGSETEVRGEDRLPDRWLMPDWLCKCGYTKPGNSEQMS